MARGAAPLWKTKASHTIEMMPYVSASINQGGMDDATGRYTELVVTGVKTRDRAEVILRGLFNAARHHEVSMTARIETIPGGYQVRFTAINKKHARAYILAKWGPDRSQWPYDPRRRNGK